MIVRFQLHSGRCQGASAIYSPGKLLDGCANIRSLCSGVSLQNMSHPLAGLRANRREAIAISRHPADCFQFGNEHDSVFLHFGNLSL